MPNRRQSVKKSTKNIRQKSRRVNRKRVQKSKKRQTRRTNRGQKRRQRGGNTDSLLLKALFDVKPYNKDKMENIKNDIKKYIEEAKEDCYNVYYSDDAKVNDTDENGRTALMLAAKNKMVSEEIMDLLIFPDKPEPPEFFVEPEPEFRGVREGKQYISNPNKFEEFKEENPLQGVEEWRGKGYYPLVYYLNNCTEDPGECEQTYYNMEKNLNMTDNDGWTALMHATEDSSELSVSKMKLLLKKGARVNTQDNKGQTALMIAASHVYKPEHAVEKITLLRSNKADVNMTDNDGKTALSIAEKELPAARVPPEDAGEAARVQEHRKMLNDFRQQKIDALREPTE